MMDNIMQCPVLVKKKLKPGQPTGDILANVIAGKDGCKGSRNKAAMSRLENLQRMCSLYNDKLADEVNFLVGKSCRNCNKGTTDLEFQNSLLVCSICQETYYCSKECQRADWKEHKKLCTPYDKMLGKARLVTQRTILCWIQEHYYDIMKALDRVTLEKNIDKRELILEIDLFADEGSAPALRTPVEFKVGQSLRYMEGQEGTRSEEPGWFRKGSEAYQNSVNNFLAELKDQYQRMTSNHLLAVARLPDGSSGVYRTTLVSQENGVGLFSDEAMDAFSRAHRDGDDSRLGPVFGEPQVPYIKARRDFDKLDRMRQQGVMNQQDETDFEDVKDLLRRMDLHRNDMKNRGASK